VYNFATGGELNGRDIQAGIDQGVIAAGAVSSGAYLFRSSVVRADQPAAGSVERLVTLTVNGQQRRVDVMKQETLAHHAALTSWGSRAPSWGCDPRNAERARF